jgi:hypothetical protein
MIDLFRITKLIRVIITEPEHEITCLNQFGVLVFVLLVDWNDQLPQLHSIVDTTLYL